jgi:hypothetical protein
MNKRVWFAIDIWLFREPKCDVYRVVACGEKEEDAPGLCLYIYVSVKTGKGVCGEQRGGVPGIVAPWDVVYRERRIRQLEDTFESRVIRFVPNRTNPVSPYSTQLQALKTTVHKNILCQNKKS